MCDSPALRSARIRLCPGAKSAIVARCRANGAQMSAGTARWSAQNSRKRMLGARFAVAHFAVGESVFAAAAPSWANWPASCRWSKPRRAPATGTQWKGTAGPPWCRRKVPANLPARLSKSLPWINRIPGGSG